MSRIISIFRTAQGHLLDTNVPDSGKAGHINGVVIELLPSRYRVKLKKMRMPRGVRSHGHVEAGAAVGMSDPYPAFISHNYRYLDPFRNSVCYARH